MSGKAKSEVDKLREENSALNKRIDALDRIVARVSPEDILDRMPEPLAEYTNDLPERLLALAKVGLANAELRAELGISGEQWIVWRREHDRFAGAASRANDLARAYWQRQARTALQSKDWKFPYSQMQKFVESMMADDFAERELRDASTRIILDLTK
ncbi:MAG: hypothetical protein GXP04_12230 [Alphaproteobacteria bacterium]|nr:hypothetical protein [Alphaproteobacteria bacterium]